MSKATPAARRKARHYAVQALYQWQLAGADLITIEAEFRADNDMSKVDGEYFHDVLHGIPREKKSLDDKISPLLDRRLDEMTPVELAIVRLGAYEMIYRVDVPYKVVINEAIELTKKFGATDGHKFINGVLDKLAQRERQVEIRGPR
ncbi:MAG TPA: transcription antitermination factor NusB [Pseudomonadales bacterium]|nr:transcription antitermination factor NusB [Pseudomonadales bacterium]